MSGRHRRERVPHELDQEQAARREALRALASAAIHLDRPWEFDDDESDPTSRVIKDRVLAAVEARQMLACKHLIGTGPQPVFLRAWEHPYVLRCAACQDVDRQPLTEEEDNTCDVCGRFDPTGIWPSQMLQGLCTIFMGRCDDCVPERVRTRKPD